MRALSHHAVAIVAANLLPAVRQRLSKLILVTFVRTERVMDENKEICSRKTNLINAHEENKLIYPLYHRAKIFHECDCDRGVEGFNLMRSEGSACLFQ